MSKNTKVAPLASSSKALEGEVIPAGINLEKPKGHDHPITLTLARFLRAADDYRDAVFIALPAVAKNRLEEIKKNSAKLNRFVSESKDDGTLLEICSTRLEHRKGYLTREFYLSWNVVFL